MMPAFYFIIFMGGTGSGSLVQAGPFIGLKQCQAAQTIVETSFNAKLWMNVQTSNCFQGVVALPPQTQVSK